MLDNIDQLAVRRSGNVSLLSLGYRTASLDDGWQACGKGANGSFHAADGTPLVDGSKFADLGEVCRHAHAHKGLGCGWYLVS